MVFIDRKKLYNKKSPSTTRHELSHLVKPILNVEIPSTVSNLNSGERGYFSIASSSTSSGAVTSKLDGLINFDHFSMKKKARSEMQSKRTSRLRERTSRRRHL